MNYRDSGSGQVYILQNQLTMMCKSVFKQSKQKAEQNLYSIFSYMAGFRKSGRSNSEVGSMRAHVITTAAIHRGIDSKGQNMSEEISIDRPLSSVTAVSKTTRKLCKITSCDRSKYVSPLPQITPSTPR